MLIWRAVCVNAVYDNINFVVRNTIVLLKNRKDGFFNLGNTVNPTAIGTARDRPGELPLTSSCLQIAFDLSHFL